MWNLRTLLLVGLLLAVGNSLHQKQQTHVLEQDADDSSSSCHYNLFLANHEAEGFGGASVAVLADSAPVEGLESVTYPVTLTKAGWIIPVTEGQVLTLEYRAGDAVENGNRVWVTNQNGETVFAVNNSKTAIFTIGAASCSCSYIQDASECPEYTLRNEWRSLSYCQQQLFVNALLLIRNVTMADGGNLYDLYITHHNSMSPLIIGKSEFLPWHRAYLSRMENDMRTLLAGNFTCVSIPYWDWSLDFSNESMSPLYAPFGGIEEESCLAAPFDYWYDPVDDGTCVYRRHSGWVKGLWAASTYPMYPPQSAVQLAVTVNNTYPFIFKFMVRNPHKSVHNYVGGALGSMSRLSSPADPLFWLHHANVDRIWALWQDCWDYDQPGTEYEQYADMSAEQDAGIDNNLISVWPGVNTTARELLNIDTLKVSYPPVTEQWAQLWGREQIHNPTFCKWDWFDAETQAKKGIHHRPQVYTNYQRERHYKTVSLYREALDVENPEYYSAMVARLNLECEMGNAWHSDDFADMFNDHMDLNKKIGPSYMFRHPCKLLARGDLYRLFYY